MIVNDSKKKPAVVSGPAESDIKPWFIGQPEVGLGRARTDRTRPCQLSTGPKPKAKSNSRACMKRIKSLGAKMVPFAGWDMPVWYTSVVEEHLATRQAAGLFDVSHMGVYDVRGADAASFLDTVVRQ